MRDILIVVLVLAGSLAALRRPWVGILVWTWLSVMNPHRYAYGFAFDAPLAAMAAACTLFGLLFTKDKESPFQGAPVLMFTLFTVWATISWLAGLDPEEDYWQWNKVIKINLMVLVALALMRSKTQIMLLAWVAIGSLGLLGSKGGIFTIANGGSYRVWGPPDSFIADNNEFALALIMTVPLLRFLQLQVPTENKWFRRALTCAMLFCTASAFGSHSRGALLAGAAMAMFFWWKGKNKLGVGIGVLVVVVGMVGFMPDEWTQRMNTIDNYQEDDSAMGRINAWWVAWRVASNYPFGAGFNVARPSLFTQYAPDPTGIHAAHSIYFQTLGNHGFVGLFLYLLIWLTTWRFATGLRKAAFDIPEARWCVDLASMTQVSLLAFLVGGAFLSLAYFDLPYYLMVLVVTARIWVQRKSWQNEPKEMSRWQRVLGLADSAQSSVSPAVSTIGSITGTSRGPHP